MRDRFRERGKERVNESGERIRIGKRDDLFL
jgi:hypothetical protein